MGPDGRTKKVMLVDAAQQTGEHIATAIIYTLSLTGYTELSQHYTIKNIEKRSANQRLEAY